MRVVVIGATGNVGTALLQALTADRAVTEVVAVARRLPSAPQLGGRGSISDPASDEPIDETWPTHGASSAAYAREKAYVERLVDLFELRTSGCRGPRT